MAGVPVGIGYEAKVEGEVRTDFRCRACGHQAVAFVRAKGEGAANAFAFIGMSAAKAQASALAHQDLLETANRMARAARCPSCGAQDQSSLSPVRRKARLAAAAALGISGVVLVAWRMIPLAVLVSPALAYWVHWQYRWQLRELDSRVRLVPVTEAEKRQQLQRVLELTQGFMVAFRWGEELSNDGVSTEVRYDLKVGLLRQGSDGPSWVDPAALGDMSGADALAMTLVRLEHESRGGFRKVARGLYQGEWDDSLAASRILVPGIFSRLKLKGAPVAFTPSEDTLFVTGSDDPAGLLEAFEYARRDARDVLSDAQSSAGRFTACPWILVNDRFVPWKATAELESRIAELAAELGPNAYKPREAP